MTPSGRAPGATTLPASEPSTESGAESLAGSDPRYAVSAGSPVRRLSRLLGRSDGDVARLVILAVLVLAIGLAAPTFLTKASWLATSQATTVIMVLAVGQAFVIVTGGIDLSVGAILACSSMAAAVVMKQQLAGGAPSTRTILIGVVVALAVGMLMGLVNGLVITRMKITPFIATLGMLGIGKGATNLLSNGTEVVGLPPALGSIGNVAHLGGWLTWPVMITIAVTAAAGTALARTRFGLRTYAIGSNSGAARRAGIDADRHLRRVYVLSGALAALAGILLMTRFVGASPLAGQDTELASIAAAVIGGASLTGGRGTILGAAIGACITGALQIGLILAGVESFWQTVVIGVVVILAVFADQARSRVAAR